MTPVDRIAMLDILYGVRVAVAPDGQHITVTGPSAVVHAAAPMLRQQRNALLAHLHAVADGGGDAFGVSSARDGPSTIQTDSRFRIVSTRGCGDSRMSATITQRST